MGSFRFLSCLAAGYYPRLSFRFSNMLCLTGFESATLSPRDSASLRISSFCSSLSFFGIWTFARTSISPLPEALRRVTPCSRRRKVVPGCVPSRHGIFYRTGKRRHLDFAAKRRDRNRDVHFKVKVISLAREQFGAGRTVMTT